MKFATTAIHGGQKPDPVTGAVITPIYQTTTYAQEELGKHKGYEYGRTHNLTREALEDNIALLENGKFGITFSSGLAAIHGVTGLLQAGDHVIVTRDIYGGTFRLFESIMKNYGLDFSWVDISKIENVEKAITPKTKLLFIETPTNPVLNLIDIALVSEIGRKNGLITVVDNTFMSPYFQNPLDLGADIVVHSSTKYINGHSDVIGGILISNDDEIHSKLRFIQKAVGAVPSPFDCWLTLRATKTLAVRMKQHNENAMELANYLENKAEIRKVFYPGLPEHPQHELAKRQMRGFGGMISIDFFDPQLMRLFLKNTKVFTLAESLGGVESLLCHPASMTHASVPEKEREELGISETLVRLSVGIEDVSDLIEDIDEAIGQS